MNNNPHPQIQNAILGILNARRDVPEGEPLTVVAAASNEEPKTLQLGPPGTAKSLLLAPSQPQPPVMDEDAFMDKFEPRNSPQGSILWEQDEVLPLIDAGEIDDRNVWTAVDTHSGIAYAAGWHAMNVFAYLVTKVKWDNPLETAEMDDETEDW